MNAYRKKMIENGGNLSWCKPFTDGNGLILVKQGSEIVAVAYDNIEMPVSVIKIIKPDVLETVNIELGCCACPCFGECAALDQ